MAEFRYTALDGKGTKRTGNVDARSEGSAVSLLKEQGYFVVSIEKKKASAFDGFKNIRGVPFGEIVAFTRQISTMISAGISITKSLEVLSQQTKQPKFRKVLEEVLRDVEGGASLADSLSRHPNVFGNTYVALVRAGEASGKLDTILIRLADSMEAERELRSTFKGAMIYPTIVVLAMIGVFFILMIFVIPKLAEMYESLNAPLPAMTVAMIAVSNFMVENVIFVFLGLGAFAFGVRYFLQTGDGKHFKSKLAFIIPVFGNLNRKKDLAEFSSTLSLLVASAVPIVDALSIVSEVVGSEHYKNGARQAAISIEKGGSLSAYLKSDENFPPIIGNMVATGEETGKLDEVLERLAEFFAKETEHAVAGLSAALEPIILVVLGAMVGFMIVSIITPIYKITSAI